MFRPYASDSIASKNNTNPTWQLYLDVCYIFNFSPKRPVSFVAQIVGNCIRNDSIFCYVYTFAEHI